MRVEMKLSGLKGVLNTLRSLPPELASKRGGPVGRALRKGAVVIRDQARKNAPVDTGSLRDAIIASRGKYSSGKGERYLVWLGSGLLRKYVRNVRNLRKNRFSDTTGAKTYETDNPWFYGRFLEYGTSKMSARPWLRPAYSSKAQEALNTISGELVKSVERIVKRLAAQNKGT